MSSIYLDYSKEGQFHNYINNAKSLLNSRADDYENISHRAYSIDDTTGNCSSCGYFVRKKYQQITSKINTLKQIDENVSKYVDAVRETDKKVASRIKQDTNAFSQRTGIGVQQSSVFGACLCGIGEIAKGASEWFSSAVKSVKQFYEDNKYWIDVVVDVVFVVAAVAACLATFGTAGFGLALLFDAFALSNSAADLIYDSAAAYQYYVKGDEAEAARLDNKGGKDAYMWVGRQLDEALGTDFLEGTFGVIHSGLAICAIAYTFYETGAQLLKDLKLDKLNIKSLFDENRSKIKWSSHFNKETLCTAGMHLLGFNAVQQTDVMKLRWGKILGFEYGKYLIKTPEMARRILEFKNIYKVGSKAYPYVKDIVSGNYKPFSKTTNAVQEYYNDLTLAPSGGM